MPNFAIRDQVIRADEVAGTHKGALQLLPYFTVHDRERRENSYGCAAAYIMKLPKSKQQAPEWQAATEALLMAAEDRRPLMDVHVGMMLGQLRRRRD